MFFRPTKPFARHADPEVMTPYRKDLEMKGIFGSFLKGVQTTEDAGRLQDLLTSRSRDPVRFPAVR